MVDRMAADVGHAGRTLAIVHCNCLERAFQVKTMAENKCQFANIIISEARGITSVYANDGGIVVAY
jgi:fatty acid-binding protein DegV